MTEKQSGRAPGAFSREFARKLNGVIGESEQPPTGRELARALSRNDGYVSERKNGKRAWSVDDVDVIAGKLGVTGLDLMLTVLGRMQPAPAESASTSLPSLDEERKRRRGNIPEVLDEAARPPRIDVFFSRDKIERLLSEGSHGGSAYIQQSSRWFGYNADPNPRAQQWLEELVEQHESDSEAFWDIANQLLDSDDREGLARLVSPTA